MRYATFYWNIFDDRIYDLKIHDNKETALKYFNSHYKDYFQLTTPFKANKLPASFGFAFRKFFGVSATGFKKMFKMSIDEAIKITKESRNEL